MAVRSTRREIKMSILKTGLQLACNGWFGDEPQAGSLYEAFNARDRDDGRACRPSPLEA
jgi:hypothetical protein